MTLITGGCGFIGSALVRFFYPVSIIDKLTYAGDLGRIKGFKHTFYKVDICDKSFVREIFKKEKPDTVIHTAAESCVDRSIKDCSNFLETNVLGTQTLMDVCREFKVKKFIHFSTDEVYGEGGVFTENSPLNPGNPYSASKAAADCLVRSYIRTYSFPAIIVRPCNNFGSFQNKEKFIPTALSNRKAIPVYGDGKQIREWLYVDDCARAISVILEKGKIGETYNVGSGDRMRNIDIAKLIGKVKYVPDRLGHDRRYEIDSTKLRALGWRPEKTLREWLKETI